MGVDCISAVISIVLLFVFAMVAEFQIRGVLKIFFSYFLMETYVVTPHKNHLELILMMVTKYVFME